MTKTAGADSGFSKRILDLLDAREMSIRELQKALEKAGADNSGYSSVFRYVKGEFPPTVAWVEAAAEVLQVTPGQLAFGDPPGLRAFMSFMEPRGWSFATDGRSAVYGGEQERPIRDAAGLAAEATAGAYGAGENLLTAVVMALVRAQPKGSPEPTEEQLRNLTLRIGFAVHGLTRAMRPLGAPDHATAAVHLGVLSAVLAFIPEAKKGRTLGDVVRYLPTPPKARPAHQEEK